MLIRRCVAIAVSLLALIGLTSVWAQKSATPARPLDPQTVAVRLLLGVGENQSQTWSGKVELDQGEVLGVDGWRFRDGDQITGKDSWEARTRLRAQAKKNARKAAAKQKKKAAAKKQASVPGVAAAGAIAPNGVIVSLKAPADASLKVTTDRGTFTVPLADLTGGTVKTYLDGKVEAQRVPPSTVVADSDDQDDFPAAGADGKGTLWVAYVVHQSRGPATLSPLKSRPRSFSDYAPDGGGDQVRLVPFANGRAGDPIDVTDSGRDVWRPAVGVNKAGAVTVVWSENREGNFDLYARTYDPAGKSWSDAKRLTDDRGSDTDPVLASTTDGTLWMAWQAWRSGRATIMLAAVEKPAQAVPVSGEKANAWTPAIAIDKSGRVCVAYDTYQSGSYDVFVRTRGSDGTLGEPVAVADSARFEARPSVAVDGRGRIWVAYEERDKDWGKDAENLQQGQGATLYRGSAVRVRCVDGGKRLDAPDPVAQAPSWARQYNGFPRVAADRQGRIWLAFRHRLEPRNNGSGGAWLEQVTSLSGQSWTSSETLARSDGMLENRPALVVPGDGPVFAVYSGDGRLSRDGDALQNAVYVAALVPETQGAADPALAAAPPSQGESPGSNVHPNEAVDIARLRDYRIQAGGKTYQLLRGEFHRHTEYSADGGNDGALEDMWRYAIDAAGLDWIGNGDHDNGGGKEYTWWITQKTTDMYQSADHFTPMFTYERSVQYPHGHRNVMWAKRGIRTLPRLQVEPGEQGVANGNAVSPDDTKMLYDYLNELGGICASHTSGTTTMGTDWRDNDPKAEPIVEIFQGHRNSYEHLGAPRVGRTNAEAIAGMQPYGMIWNAFALNYKLGFQASSDHISTHISYAIAVAEDHNRDAILDAFRTRHCYAATDNILLDVRSGDHLMGDEFDADGPVQLKVIAQGTRPIKRVDVIKDYVYVYSTEPNRDRVEFSWTDNEHRPPVKSWYYVRVIQDDGELAWASPMWVNQRRNTAGE